MKQVVDQIKRFQVTLTEEVIEATKIAFLDTINALVVGMQEPEIKQLSNMLKTVNNGEGSHTVIGQFNTLPTIDAAFLMGAASVAVELDEGNQWSKGHPAVHVFPLLLMHAQQHPEYTGQQFMKDFVKSYEIATYFGRITTLKPSLHAHGTWGLLGSAATFGVIHNVDEEKMAQLLNTAATFASPTQWSAAIEGAIIRNIYMAESIVGGYRAWQLTEANIHAPKQNAEAIFSNILGTSFDVTQSFSQGTYSIQLNYYKFHAFCRYVHVPIEVFQTLVKNNAIKPEQIERVDVLTYARAATLANQAPTNTLGAKFSIPFAIAAWAYTGRTDHGVFTERYLQDEAIQQLASKIHVIHDPVCDEDYPNIMPAVVHITLKDGTTVSHSQNAAQGGPDEKATFEQISQKFFENTENILTSETQQAVIDFVNELNTVTNVGEIVTIINRGLKEELS